jgi:hypothetical protein
MGERRGDALNLGPEIGGEVSVGLGKGVESSLDEVLGSSGVTSGWGVNIIDTGELEEFLGDGGTNNTSSSGSGHELASYGTTFTSDLSGNGMDVSDLVSPIASSDGNEGEFGGNEGTLDGNLHFFGDLDTETDVTVVISNGNEGLEASSLSGLGLLLDGDNFHDFVGKFNLSSLVGLLLGDEFFDNLGFLDWDSVSVDFFERLNVVVLDESSELCLWDPVILSGATTTSRTATASSTSTTSTATWASSGSCFCHSSLLK